LENTTVKQMFTTQTALRAVKICSEGILVSSRRYGKSPCFSGVAFLQLFGPDYPMLVLPSVDGPKNMERAF
jgi:hypothetical protein